MRAAAALGNSYRGSINASASPSGCFLKTEPESITVDGFSSNYNSSAVAFNSHENSTASAQTSDQKLLCATGAPFRTRWPHPSWQSHYP
jgi:hypothetical protein